MRLKFSLSPLAGALLAAAGIALLGASPAFAGGLQKGTQAANDFVNWYYGFVGVTALGYLGWKGTALWQDKETWGDFGTAIAKVAGVGGTLVVAPWAWSLLT